MDVDGERSSIVIGLIENRAKEVGMAAFNMRSAALDLSQYIETSISYHNTKTLLQFYDPMVIIVPPNKLAADGMVGVSELVDRFYAPTRKVIMARGCFDDTKGAVMVKSLAAKDPSALGLETYYKQYYLCLAAAAATIKWIEGEKGVIVTNHSLSVTFNGSFNHMNIDATSVHNLELIDPLHSSLLGTTNKKKSLFHMLKTTKTAGGTRLLRANLLQPLKDIETINARLNCLDELMSNEQLFFGLTQVLRKFPKETVGEVIDEDVLHARVPFIARTQQCFAVKAGIDGLLDIARRTFCDTSEAIHTLANKYREEFKLPNLKLPFNNRQGFYFSIPQKDIQGKLPRKFIQNEQLNVRNKSAAGECYIRTEVCLEALVDAIREDVSALTLLAEALCLLDMIVNSFAHTISTKPSGQYVRPEFTNDGPLAIDSGRHPILETIHNEFVPNNIFISEASNMVTVMGPNMSGKSTYLQQVCLIVILAQIGCYVPACFATIRVVDRIFTRMGSTDSLESNSSTFMTEMRETAFIMQNVSQRSLIVMDELGRATSSTDGFSIAWSCCEHLLSLKAYTIFATHMENLAELAVIYPNVKILHFDVDIRNNRLDFKFQLKDGPRHIPHYGLLLAEVAGLPSSVIETARTITSNITQRETNRMDEDCEQHQQLQMVYRVAQRLLCLKFSSQHEDSIRQALQNLKDSYLDGTL
ncbi:DNA mismatch repair protein MSH4 [Linum perenne]